MSELIELPATELTEQTLEGAMLALFDNDDAPAHIRVNPWIICRLLGMRNASWQRSAYLRRRRGWAPK